MMKIISFLLMLPSIVSCRDRNHASPNHIEGIPRKLAADTVIVSQIITDQLPGSAYRKRATAYFIVVNSDTSDFRPVFMEYNDGNIGVDLNISYSRNNITHEQRMNELAKILKKATNEYSMESLRGIRLGRLILTGDVAVEVTRQCKYPVFQTVIG